MLIKDKITIENAQVSSERNSGSVHFFGRLGSVKLRLGVKTNRREDGLSQERAKSMISDERHVVHHILGISDEISSDSFAVISFRKNSGSGSTVSLLDGGLFFRVREDSGLVFVEFSQDLVSQNLVFEFFGCRDYWSHSFVVLNFSVSFRSIG
jgi:hypothetical protein